MLDSYFIHRYGIIERKSSYLCQLNQAIINSERNASFQLKVNNNMLIMFCYQGITFLHSHTFVKISEFAQFNEVKGILVEMTQLRSCLPHSHTVENICTSQRGFIT